MPIYGYVCNSCDHSFEALQKINEPRLVDCPACNEASLRKRLSAPKFRLKGKGWYETDFKTGDKRNIAGDTEKTASSKPAESGAKDDKSKSTKASTEKASTEKASTDSKAKSA